MNTRKEINDAEGFAGSKLLCASFNQDQSCFAVGYENGFRVYNADPMDIKVKREFGSNGGIGLTRMLYRTNYLALIGGGKNPRFPLNKVIIWDDLKTKDALNLNFYSPVLNVYLSRTRIVVVLNNKIYIHGFSSPPKSIAQYETFDNPLGISSLSPGTYQDQATNLQILAFPARVVGQIQIVDISSSGQERNLVSIIKAHKSKIRCLALNKSGTMLASASETGTIIRIHSTQNCSLLYEFRRGLDRAEIYSMEFSQNGSKLAVLSDKQTLHVFNITNNQQQSNKHHILKNLPGIVRPAYFNSTWSFCSIHLKNEESNDTGSDSNDDRGVLGWSSESSIIILWKLRGKWEKYVIIENEEITSDGNHIKKFELVREGWRSFGDLNE
ncbi:WD repeat domain phosphoinositide-interacting protein 4 [Wickerhamomyces ciferrii]|uniref:WD repeat domain phosphoinositide-interacting protein 4 n=1 Tax=Wickerhamomyces ciferrii (strain ATCC 14091 / BCRC 22168 / CBS 111 / JCM 3599 / NBRC 0793 / NRRL Y-1031 F-60-10) TaxID=1206466 RepID=K0KET9_WICCF|nr:WD repeat domain phosphoinositide-interacting protein 4 [Wickerhamomyces ciferrii]CCH41456.1 WD repeat domain phosphoinositide-interacting protein 4 [Wickerhamomyces ciferrii]